MANNDELDRLHGAHARVAASRDGARRMAVAAVRGVERRLIEALGANTLRGLPLLMPGSRPEYRGVRVRSEMRFDEVLPRDGRPVLVLSVTGRLEMASMFVDGSLRPGVRVARRLVTDDEIVAEDVAAVIVAVDTAVRLHLERLDATAARYDRTRDVAERVVAALSPRAA